MEMVKILHNRIKEFCRQKGLFAPGDRVVVGLSGGADSVCLFLVLQSLAEEWKLGIVPVHINHNLRGEEAMRDQVFCEELCRQYGLELQVISVQVAELAREHGWTLEEAGRNARYQTFSEVQREFGCHKIAVAHHKNDQVETVLFQFLRGSRLKGLAGMEAKHDAVVRPLLCVERKEIERYLEEKQQWFCIDCTNLEEDYTRNKIRHRFVPLAKELQPRAVEHIAETAEYLGRVETLLERLTQELYEQCVEVGVSELLLRIPPLENAEPLLAERVMYRVLCEACGGKKDITAGYVSDCMELRNKQTGRYLTLPGGVIVTKSYETLRFGKQQDEPEPVQELISEFPYYRVLPEGAGVLSLSLQEFGPEYEIIEEKMGRIPKSTYTKWFDYDKIKGVVSWRNPGAEDVIAVYADGRSKRVLDVLKDAKVPKEKRERIGILAVGTQVLWIPGIRGSEAYRVTEETKRVLVATINGGNENGR